jgi:hypothetical protein
MDNNMKMDREDFKDLMGTLKITVLVIAGILIMYNI